MDAVAFQERVKRLKEINEVIEKLDPAIREHAFAVLASYATGQPHRPTDGAHQLGSLPEGKGDQSEILASELFAKHPEGKPSDNAVLIAAFLYSQYGSQPFKLDEMRGIAESVGVTIPASLDMTLRQAKRDGKSLFQHTGRSEFKPTVHGELYFKKTYEVSTGTKKRPTISKEV